jgi:hypothetical protein
MKEIVLFVAAMLVLAALFVLMFVAHMNAVIAG